MHKGWVLKVLEVAPHVRVGTTEMFREYQGITEPNHKCQTPRYLQRGDCVTVKNVTPSSLLVTVPCGCDYLLYDQEPNQAGTRAGSKAGPMEYLHYLNQKDSFLNYAYQALRSHFPSRKTFEDYFNAIKTEKLKNVFLRTTSFYLFLVKGGDWVVNIRDCAPIVDYLTNTHKYMLIFSLIESLSEDDFVEFYAFLTKPQSAVKFPIEKAALEGHYKKYKASFGSIRRCVSFFQALSPEDQRDLIARLEVMGTKPTIENFVKQLYQWRSKSVHNADLALHMSEGISVGQQGTKMVVCNLSIQDLMTFFEKGLIIYFRPVAQLR